ncbi:fibronectin type III domain-containing protein, partial [Fulvivirga lutimaris]|uniref:fibronectin type III domain-containing protein n=1 Tax=Fulvivirga lutimaris TaxID=1819566 RepID=UPI001FE48D66
AQEIPFPEENPPYNQLSPWGHSDVGTNWDTSDYLPFIYQGLWFRIIPPNGVEYNSATNSWTFPEGEEFPLMIFNTGAGERGADNNEQLKHGGKQHRDAVVSDRFRGFVVFWQTETGFVSSASIESLVNKLINELPVNRDRVYTNGFSRGGLITWQLIRDLPHVFAAGFPMSAASNGVFNLGSIHVPVRLIQGGKDGNPTPEEAASLVAQYETNGGDIEYYLYDNLGHGTWNTAYAFSDFFEWFLDHTKNRIHVFYGFTEICPEDPVNIKLGLTAGFTAYEWRKDGVLINGATSNEFTVTELGSYTARFSRGGNWTDWSEPVVISTKLATVTPPISVAENMSYVLPALDGSANTTLELPEGYAEYEWRKNGAVVSNSRVFADATPGDYIAQVKEFGGCSSSFGDPFTVVSADGNPKPDAPSNLRASNVDKTQLKLNWDQNPIPFLNELGFEIYRSLSEEGPFEYVHRTEADVATYTDLGLTTNTNYFYKIRSVGATGASAQSNLLSVTTNIDTNKPTSPSNLNITATTGNSISISWNEATDDVAVVAYDIYLNSRKTFVSTSTTFEIPGLTKYEVYDIYVRARDAVGNTSAESNHVTGVPVVSGVNYEYYEIDGLSLLPDFSAHAPLKQGTSNNFDISTREVNDNFAYKFSGFIQIPTDGRYTFYTSSDDGSKLYIGGFNESNLIVNNDGLHGSRERSGTINLTEGTHPIFVTFFERGGGERLEVRWSGPGVSKGFIPDAVLREDFEIPGTAPVNPSSVSAIAIDYKSVNVTWVDNAADETGYQIFRATDEDPEYRAIATLPSGSTSYLDESLQSGTTYHYQIVALGQYGQSEFFASNSKELGDINYGIAAIDNASGDGYIMYSEENVFTRFATALPNSSNSSNLIAVRLNGSTWQYDNNNSYYDFTPLDSDVLLAEVDFTNDAITDLKGQSGAVNGIAYGYLDGDLEFYADRWGGSNNNGEFTITGTYFDLDIPTSASATTSGLPQAPISPSNFSLSGATTSTIDLSWDDVFGELNYELYRSLNGTEGSFELIQEVPENETSFSDSGLFPHLTYFYQLVAVNDGGASVPIEIEVMTANTNPTASTIEDISIRFDGESSIFINASDADGDEVFITSANLPSFAELVDYGDATAEIIVQPSIADEGTYDNLVVAIADNFGGLFELSFDMIVNSNYTPEIEGVEDVIMNESDEATVVLTASDLDGDAITWNITNAPVMLASTVDGNEITLNFAPGLLDAGNYAVNVTANDGNLGIATAVINVTVNEFDPNYEVFVNFGASGGEANAPWNNMLGDGSIGSSINDLLDSNGTLTPISISLESDFSGSSVSGGVNSGIYPDAVMLSYFWTNSVPEQVRISGLNPDYIYNLEMLGSRNSNGDRTTVFTVGSESASVNATQNTSNTARLEGLVPDVNGDILMTVTLGSGASYGYLNSMIIESRFDDGSVPANPGDLVASLTSTNKVVLEWTDIAFNEQGYKIYRSTLGEEEEVVGTVGVDATSYEDISVVGHTAYSYRVSAFSGNGESSTSIIQISTNNNAPELELELEQTALIDVQTDIDVVATDLDGDRLEVSFVNLPAFGSYTSMGNGIGSLSFTPSVTDIGSYAVQVLIKDYDNSDNLLSTTPIDLQLTVTDRIEDVILINFSVEGEAGSPWNNTNTFPSAGKSFVNLLTTEGSTTTVDAALLDGWSGGNSQGFTTGDDSGMYPDIAMSTYYADNSNTTKRISFTDLDPSKLYDFVFFASRAGITEDRFTEYTIGSKRVTLNSRNNSNGVVRINAVSPDVNGEIVVGVARAAGSSWAYINAMELHYYEPSSLPGEPLNLSAKATSKSSITLEWSDNSNNETGFEVYRSQDETGPFSLVTTVGVDVESYEDGGLATAQAYYYKLRSVNSEGESPYTSVVGSSTLRNSIYINIGGVGAVAGSPWNNTNNEPFVGNTYSNLLTDDGSPSGVDMDIVSNSMGTSFANSGNGGATTGNDSGVFPDVVIQSYFWIEQLEVATFKFSNLNLTRQYDFEFFGSRTIDKRGTDFTINGETVTLDAYNNTSNTVRIDGVLADENGEIFLDMNSMEGATLAHVGAIVIYVSDVLGEDANARQSADVSDQLNLESNEALVPEFKVYPNPFDSQIRIRTNDKIGQVYLVDNVGRVIKSPNLISSDFNE